MKKRTISLCLLLFMMGIIFMFSHQPGVVSEGLSLGIVDKLVDVETGDSLFVHFLHVGIRKSAHIASYCILTLLSYFFVSTFDIKGKSHYRYTFLIPLLYACSDEIHQTFVPNRLGSITDVFIDSIGILIALLFIYIIKKRLTPQNNLK